MRTFMVEIYLDKKNIETLVHLNENEFLSLEGESLKRKEDICDIFVREYMQKKFVLKEENLIYIKDYSSLNKSRYLLLNVGNFTSILISVKGPVYGKIDSVKEFNHYV